MERDNQSLSANEIAVGALLAGNRGGYGGGGYGAWGGGGYGGFGPFAGPSSNAVRINRNQANTTNQAENTRDLLKGAIDANAREFNAATIRSQFDSLRDGQFQAEIRTNDRLLALQQEMNANARRQAECCCETQKLVLSENAATRELLTQQQLNAAQTEASEARIIRQVEADLRHHHHPHWPFPFFGGQGGGPPGPPGK